MLCEFPDYEALSQAAARNILLIGQRCVAECGQFELVLAGGKTPSRAYAILAQGSKENRKLWENTHVFWGDERCVSPDHEESNYHVARLAMLDSLRIPPNQIHRIPADDPNIHEAAAIYEAVFPQEPDVLLLGMGAEGHTASLFPGSPALDETRRRFVAVEVPVEPRRRITMTPPAIASAREILVLVSGADKADALKRVLTTAGDFHKTPARLVRDAVWFVDQDATKGLSDSHQYPRGALTAKKT
jgi:6-phosphogluconolactonase